jgi:hypothetical protein
MRTTPYEVAGEPDDYIAEGYDPSTDPGAL